MSREQIIKFMKRSIFSLAIILAIAASAFAQSMNGTPAIKYRRSSLHTILVESDRFPYRDTVLTAYYNAPFPEKYNNHTIGEKSFDPKRFPLNKQEVDGLFNSRSKFSNAFVTDSSRIEMKMSIEKYLKLDRIANKLVAKWFNRQTDGSFDMNLIGDRGSYNASEMQANIAKGSARGVSALRDAGVELIGNTFVVVSRFNFVSNEIIAAGIRQAAMIPISNLNGLAQKFAVVAANLAYNKAKEGYSVWTTSYLYKLTWNDSIEAVFYNDLWMDKTNLSQTKIEAFDNSKLFNLEYVGDEKAVGLVLFSLKEKRTPEQIVKQATIRTIDAVYAKLQKKYDVFMPKVPLFSGDPITSKIGMKEGLEGGEKFEVFEQALNEKTGLTEYISKGTIKVDKNLIWDNRFSEGDAASSEGSKQTIDRTTFKGGKGLYAGMLIKQIK